MRLAGEAQHAGHRDIGMPDAAVAEQIRRLDRGALPFQHVEHTPYLRLAPFDPQLRRLLAQHALVGYVHPFDTLPDPAKEDLRNELPVDVALGKVDYYEAVGFSDHRATNTVWYRLLNCGFRLSAGAGTDAMTNYASLRGPVGMNRVYVHATGTSADPEKRRAAFLAGLPVVFPSGGNESAPLMAGAESVPHPLIGKYCMSCHDEEEQAANLSFEALDLDRAGANAEIWEKVGRKLSAGLMPPAGNPRPSPEERDEFLETLLPRLDAAAPCGSFLGTYYEGSDPHPA